MSSQQVISLTNQPIEITDSFSKNFYFSNNLIAIPQTDSTIIFDVVESKIKYKLPLNIEQVAISEDLSYFAFSKSNKVIVFNKEAIEKNLSSSNPSHAFTSNSLLRMFFHRENIILISLTDISVYSLNEKTIKTLTTFSSFPNAPSMSNFKPYSFSMDKKFNDFCLSGLLQDSPASFIISKSLNKIIEINSPFSIVSNLPVSDNSVFYMIDNSNIQIISIENGKPSRESLKIFDPSLKISYFYISKDSDELTAIETNGTMKTVSLSSKQEIQSESLPQNIKGRIISHSNVNQSIFFLTTAGEIITIASQTTSTFSNFENTVFEDYTNKKNDISLENDYITDESFIDYIKKGYFAKAIELTLSDETRYRTPEMLKKICEIPTNGSSAPLYVKYLFELLKSSNLKVEESFILVSSFIKAKKEASVPMIMQWWTSKKISPSVKLANILRFYVPSISSSIYSEKQMYQELYSTLALSGKYKEVFEESQKNLTEPDLKYIFTLMYTSSQENQQIKDKIKNFIAFLFTEEKKDLVDIADIVLENNDHENYQKIMMKYFNTVGDREEDLFIQTKFLKEMAKTQPSFIPSLLFGQNPLLTHYEKSSVGEVLEDNENYILSLLFIEDSFKIKEILDKTIKKDTDTKMLIGFFKKKCRDNTNITDYLIHILKLKTENGFILVSSVLESCYPSTPSLIQLDQIVEEVEKINDYQKILYLILKGIINSFDKVSFKVLFSFFKASLSMGRTEQIETIIDHASENECFQIKDYLLSHKISNISPFIKVCSKIGVFNELVTFAIENKKTDELFAHIIKNKEKNIFLEVLNYIIIYNLGIEYLRNCFGVVEKIDMQYIDIYQMVDENQKTDEFESFLLTRTQNKSVCTALALINTKKNPQVFKNFVSANQNNLDLKTIANIIEIDYPMLALHCYKILKSDEKILEISQKIGSFDDLCFYVIDSSRQDLWDKVLDKNNIYREAIVDSILNISLKYENQSKKIAEIIKVLTKADMPRQLSILLERLLFSSEDNNIRQSQSLQNLLIITVARVEKGKIPDLLISLKNYNAELITSKLEEMECYEEALLLNKLQKKYEKCVFIIVNKMNDFNMASDFINEMNEIDQKKEEIRKYLYTIAIRIPKLYPQVLEIAVKKKLLYLHKEIFEFYNEESENLFFDYLTVIKGKVVDSRIENKLLEFYIKKNDKDKIFALIEENPHLEMIGIANKLVEDKKFEIAIFMFKILKMYDKVVECYIEIGDIQNATEYAFLNTSNSTKLKVFLFALEKNDKEYTKKMGLKLLEKNEMLDTIIKNFLEKDLSSDLMDLFVTYYNSDAHKSNQFLTQIAILYSINEKKSLFEFLKNNWENISIPRVLNEIQGEEFINETLFLLLMTKNYYKIIEITLQNPEKNFNEETFLEAFKNSMSPDISIKCLEVILKIAPWSVEKSLTTIKCRIDPKKIINLAENNENIYVFLDYLDKIAIERKDRYVTEYLINFYISNIHYKGFNS